MSKKKKTVAIIAGAVGAVALLNISAFFIGLHSPVVYWGGKIFNFAVFFGGLAILVFVKREEISEWFARRRDQIAKNIKNALTRQKSAREKLAEIEIKIANLQKEIDEIIYSARKGAEADALRMKNETTQRENAMLARARQEIELLTESAKRELGRYAANRTTEIAMAQIEKRLDDKMRSKLFASAVAALSERLDEAIK